MKSTRRFFGPLFVAAMLLAVAVPAVAGPPAQQAVPHGTVIALAGTPHLWVGDDTGTLHWGGDTRALAGKFVNWGDRREVSLDQLRGFRRGEPWLSAGLIKIGDPIYLVKWETNQAQPALLHIQSIADVELFGIDGSNYGRFVLSQTSWEQQFNMMAGGLTKGTLASAVAPTATATSTAPSGTVTPTPSPLKLREVAVEQGENNSIKNTIEVTGAPPGRRLKVSAELTEWICSPSCDSTRTDKWGPLETGPTDSGGRLIYTDEHFLYKDYTYTFEDVNGNKATITFKDDRVRFGLS